MVRAKSGLDWLDKAGKVGPEVKSIVLARLATAAEREPRANTGEYWNDGQSWDANQLWADATIAGLKEEAEQPGEARKYAQAMLRQLIITRADLLAIKEKWLQPA